MFDIILITGGAGAGKTTTAEAWAASRSGVAAHVSHDSIMSFIKAGIASPAATTDREAERQWRLAIEVCVAAAEIYASTAVRCAIDTFLLPPFLPYWNGLADFRVGAVVLQPRVEVAVERNATRLRDRGWGVAEWQVRANHTAMQAWSDCSGVLLVDNSALGLQEVLATVDAWEADVQADAHGIWSIGTPESQMAVPEHDST
jgi:chloramphenicol 3-O-phosphotransferase